MPRSPQPLRHARRRPVRRPLHHRVWPWFIFLTVAVAISGALWVGLRGLEAKSQLEAAQTKVSELKTQAVALDIEAATSTLGEIQGHTSKAVRLTSDPIWRAAELVPKLGVNLSVVRELAAVTDDVMVEVVVPLVTVAGSVNPASFGPKDGAIDIQPLIDAVPAVQQANIGIVDALTAVGAIDTAGAIEQVSAAKLQLSGLLDEIAPTLETLNTVVPLIAPALGSEAPRTYALMFQNPAESRALGGTALSFAVIKADKGRIELTETKPAGFGNFPVFDEPVIPLPDGAEEVYPGFLGRFIPNATSRPSFTTAATITQETWIRVFGYPLDGVISIDPVALSYVLRATDPITLSTGDALTSESLVPLLLNGLYQRFNSGNARQDNIAQDVVYAEAVGAAFARITGGPLDPNKLLGALAQGWDERRLLYWSANADEQAQLAAAGLNGEIPVSDSETERVGLYFQDNVGSKLTYYLKQAVNLGHASCRADGRQSNRVSVDITNAVDPATTELLSISIVGNWEKEGVQRGAQRLIVLLYAPAGAEITSAVVGGTPVVLAALQDAEFPVGKVVVTVPPGETVNVTYDFVSAEPGEKALEAQVTPMVTATPIETVPLDCATVHAE